MWFNAQNVGTQWPSCKLDHKRLGSYKIIKVVLPHSFKIEFSLIVKYYQVQHISLLDPYDDDPLLDQHNRPPPLVVVDNEEEWHVQEIFDMRIRRRQLEYLVKWVGYNNTTWEPAMNVNKLQAVDRFHERYPDKPGPLPDDDDDNDD